MAVASAGPYADHLHLAPDRQPRQHLIRPDASSLCSCRIWISVSFYLTSRFLWPASGSYMFHFTTHPFFHPVTLSHSSNVSTPPQPVLPHHCNYVTYSQSLPLNSVHTVTVPCGGKSHRKQARKCVHFCTFLQKVRQMQRCHIKIPLIMK